MSRPYGVSARGRVEQLQDVMVGRERLLLSEAARLVGVSGRQIRRDVKRHSEAGLAVISGQLCWVSDRSAPATESKPRTLPQVAVVRCLDLLDMLRDGPVTEENLKDTWTAGPTELAADLSYLIANGWVRRERQNGRTTYDLGTVLTDEPPWSAEQTRALLTVVAQAVPRYARPSDALLTARDKLRDWLRALEEKPANRPPSCRLIKGGPLRANPQVEDLVVKLEAAARRAHRVRLRYRGATDRLLEPLGVVYYWVTDAWYLVAYPPRTDGEPQVLRLDRISRVRVLADPFLYPPGFDLTRHFRLSWGVGTGPVLPIRVRFYDEAGVLARLRREVAHRLAPAGEGEVRHLPGRPYILYTDRIQGQGEFRHWLRTFGSSAVVEEPAGLRREMAERARALLEVYRREPE